MAIELPISIELPNAFLEDEVRSDYFVSGSMKKVWAVQLDLLNLLDEVCTKHGLTYYVVEGSLLGAIRHGGYIPWDDDIDVAMMRDDYDKLVAIGPEVFKHPYFLQNAYSDCFARGFSRLRNSETTAITLNDYRLNCNKGLFIDIFPLDYVPSGFNASWKWAKRLRLFSLFMRIGVNSSPRYYSSFGKKALCGIANASFKVVDWRKAFRRYEQMASKYDEEEAECVSLVAHVQGKKGSTWPKEVFSQVERRSFEFLEISIPKGWDQFLSITYGDYMTPKQVASWHGQYIFDSDIDYETYLKIHSESEIEQVIKNMNQTTA